MKIKNQHNILVSIIIPAYNVENYIEECIHSAFAQTYANIEVICIDNNSTDNSWQKFEQLQKKYPQLIIEKEIKPGAPAARNKGLKLSKGQWIQFLDADDILLPDKIKHQQHLIQNKTDAAFISGACIRRNITGNDTIHLPKQDHPFKSLFTTQLGITSSNLWNRQSLENINGWDETLKSSQEADLMFRLLKINENIIFDNNPLSIIRERTEGQISQQNQTTKWEQYFQKRIEMLHWIRNNRVELYAQYQSFFSDALFGILKIIAIENLKKANNLYIEHLKGHYQPSKNQTHSTKSYLVLFKIFGFKGAEIIRSFLGKGKI